MTYKMIFCDLDGTALDADANLSRENADAIHELAKQGISFVPATGRALGEIPPAVREHPNIRYLITSNGTAVWDKAEGCFIATHCVCGAELDTIRRLLPDYIILRNIHKDGISYFDGPAYANYPYYSMTDYFHDCLYHLSEHPENFDEVLQNATDIEMFSLFFKYKEELQAFAARLAAAGNYYITASTDLALEVTAAGAGKGAAIGSLLQRLGIAKEETIGIGDSKNDITMLETVGLALAVEHACPALKQHAKHVICPHDAHAVRYVLEHLLPHEA